MAAESPQRSHAMGVDVLRNMLVAILVLAVSANLRLSSKDKRICRTQVAIYPLFGELELSEICLGILKQPVPQD